MPINCTSGFYEMIFLGDQTPSEDCKYAVEATLQTKAQIVAKLKEAGDAFAKMLEGLNDETPRNAWFRLTKLYNTPPPPDAWPATWSGIMRTGYHPAAQTKSAKLTCTSFISIYIRNVHAFCIEHLEGDGPLSPQPSAMAASTTMAFRISRYWNR